MAKTIPIGQMRVNPNTFMSEVWDGNRWDDTIRPQTINSISTLGLPIGSANGITTSTISGKPTPRDMEDVYEFLKENLRVAEYTNGNGKIDTVQLEMRLGPGYTWENIRRIKI